MHRFARVLVLVVALSCGGCVFAIGTHSDHQRALEKRVSNLEKRVSVLERAGHRAVRTAEKGGGGGIRPTVAETQAPPGTEREDIAALRSARILQRRPTYRKDVAIDSTSFRTAFEAPVSTWTPTV